MIRIYCHGHKHHITEGDTLCQDCRELLAYCTARLEKCPFGNGKTSCRACRKHCYAPDYRTRIKAVMRYSGPRMLLRSPIIALSHIFR